MSTILAQMAEAVNIITVSKRGVLIFGLALLAAVFLPFWIARSLLDSARLAEISPEPNYLQHRPSIGQSHLDSIGSSGDFAATILSEKTVDQGVPRLFMARLPAELPDIKNSRSRKRLFVATMLPLILHANELIQEERAILSSIRYKIATGQRVRNSEKVFLRRVEAWTRIAPDLPRTKGHIDTLLSHVDIIPPSLALTQAAIESGWGTSRFAQKGNALFGEWVWGDAKGMMPSRREAGKTHKIKSFDFLIDSVRSYMKNLNRTSAYADLRRDRLTLRRSGQTPTGRDLAPSLQSYSERGDAYVQDVLAIMRQNNFGRYDRLYLQPTTRSSLLSGR